MSILEETAISTLNALSATCWDRGLTGDYSFKMNMEKKQKVAQNEPPRQEKKRGL